MRKAAVFILSAFLLAGCGSAEKEAAQVTAIPTPGVTVEKNLGRKVINAGYQTVTEEVYSDQKEESPDLKKLTPDQKTVVSFNYDAQRTEQQVYEKQNGKLVLTLNAKYKYDGDAIKEADILDENGNVTVISVLKDGAWTDTDANGTALNESLRRDEWGNIILLADQKDGSTLQRTYDVNGWLLEEKVLDAQGTEVSDTIWHRYSNDELADEIVRTTASGTETRLLNRGDRVNDTAVSWYTDSAGKRYQQITDQYESSMIVKRTDHNLETDTYTITAYTYE